MGGETSAIQRVEACGGAVKYADSRLKKFLNFVGTYVDPDGVFLYKMRRARGMDALLRVCDEFMLGENAEKPYPPKPYEGVCSRPNHEQ